MMSTSPARMAASRVATLAMLATALLQASQQGRATFRSSARLVELSVVVTDRGQNPVTGLTADDFQVFDDGKLQKVQLFSIETVGATTGPSSEPKRDAREFSNKTSVTDAVTIILMDQLNTGAADGCS